MANPIKSRLIGEGLSDDAKKEVAYFDDSIVVTVYPVVEIANFSEWV